MSGYFPETKEDLDNYIEELENKPHDYSSIADALTDVTLAFFNYFASKYGMTGFQASWSAMRFLGKSRNIEAPFMVIDSGKMLYPQYDIIKEVENFLEDSKPELAKIAKDNLKNNIGQYTSPNVIKRWCEIAEYDE